MSGPPSGFERLPVTSAFVGLAGVFYMRVEPDGSRTVGTLITDDQSNSEGSAHGGFLLCFADYAITIVTMSITLSMTVDFLRPANVGQWIEARINVRKASANFVFADTIVTGEGHELLRGSGLFRPVDYGDRRTSDPADR